MVVILILLATGLTVGVSLVSFSLDLKDSPTMAKRAVLPRDGELALPAGYTTWPKFLSEVQRPDAKQVREIYINPVGARTEAGRPFPDGTIMVMELYRAKAEGEALAKGPDGKLAKGDLVKVFVMGKGEGWGQDVPANLRNGTWLYAAYGPDAKPLREDFTKCRACHAPLVQKDFVHRYDQYFEARTKRMHER
ncbi:MAG: cytochrome P460 family protein [Nitrospirota bacterium]